MATMKYIGARYMPKFMGTYDATSAYEALSVVDNGTGTTYVANKPVPVGTPLTDTEYWAVYGASSGAILDLQSRMGIAENDIDALELADQNIIADIKKRNLRNIICVGDSYGQWIENTSVSWISFVRDHIEGGGAFYHTERGGSGFLAELYDPTEETYYSFKKLLTLLAPSITDKNSISDIVVCGGYNDLSAGHDYIAQLPAKIAEFAAYARATFPNARIYVGMIGRSTGLSTCNLLLNETYPYYKQSCMLSGITYLTGVENSIKNDANLQIDGFHPNDSGSIEIGSNVLNLLNGVNTPRYTKQGSAVTPPTGASNTMLLTLKEDGAGIEISCDNSVFEYDTAQSITFSAGTTLTLGTINADFGHIFENIFTSVDIYINDTSNVFHHAVGSIYIDDRAIKVRVKIVESNVWATIAVKAMNIAAFTLRIPSQSY